MASPTQWVAGFTSGDGCFKVSIRESKLHKRGSRVVLLFVVTQHIRDELLLKSLVDFFGCVGEASKLILIKIILSSDVNHSKIIMKRFYLFSINTLSLALNLRISKIELK
uniref:LAGLIDADG endonuclease n=4 Tax=Fusarium pseudograminearum TaxID=101028 RepID=A0A6G6B0W8_FUSPS|nr:LAGLIDADG endonuclease [Fusarium pseudograminearum]CDL72467.1 Mitochondrion small subunit rRNA intron and ORF1 n1 TaxSclerotinia sclerotiorum RepIDQ35928_SCLSC [Fusarium pseudograminearum CS3220]CDL73096.1 Mitochondrion small subunit rRNA intron and ORF1 n1 TaxSclerotinia sclerotiorum RepIDQ35928_SCLSC [Fusarium pseudograminearum CS3427]CDL73179.1 Mitochondrion small subunit rRNA intron and ORF1 n1 TaxSclerotinia sclerotiorum RepIDQ35928_SCLSC [Fusarium pseudograminearum CS3487]QID41608.1 LA